MTPDERLKRFAEYYLPSSRDTGERERARATTPDRRRMRRCYGRSSHSDQFGR